VTTDLKVRFGGLTMQSAIAMAPGLTITSMEGWSDGVKGVYDEQSVPGSPGSFEVPVDLSSRLVTMEGYCLVDSFTKLRGWRDAVTGQVGGAKPRPFIVDELGETEWAPAQCVGAKFPIFGGQTFADFSLSFWMPKPWKFGEAKSFANGVAAVQYGNTSSVPSFKIGGVRPDGYTIAGPGTKALIVSAPVVEGIPHEYDMTEGELLIGGVVVDGKVARADSWAVPQGTGFAHSIFGGSGDFQTLLRKVTR
jgi:hypothetical protein